MKKTTTLKTRSPVGGVASPDPAELLGGGLGVEVCRGFTEAAKAGSVEDSVVPLVVLLDWAVVDPVAGAVGGSHRR